MSQGALTFMHLAIGLGGAGIAIYGAQKVCDKKINKTAYESCLKQSVKKGSTKETIKKACDTKYKPGGDIIPTIIMWSGMGIILLTYVILSYLNGGLFGGGMGGMMGGMGGMGGMGYGGQQGYSGF